MHPKQWLSHAIGAPVSVSKLSISNTVRVCLLMYPGTLQQENMQDDACNAATSSNLSVDEREECQQGLSSAQYAGVVPKVAAHTDMHATVHKKQVLSCK